MKRSRRMIVSVLVTLGAFGAAMAAAPNASPSSRPGTTRPTSRPAEASTPALTDRDSVEVKSPKYKLSFRVPKGWEKANVSVSGGDAEIYQYGRPQPRPVRISAKSPAPTPDRYVSLFLGKPCHPGTTIDDLAKQSREGIVALEGHPVDYLRDAADTVSGRPAWRIDYPFEAKSTGWKLVGGNPVQEQLKIKSVRRMLVWLRGESFCELQFVYDQASEQTMTRLFDQIAASIKETD